MSISRLPKIAVAVAASFSMVATPVMAATPSDLADLIGVKGSSGET
ncbi:hypothetical protein [Sphingorhabdus sp.]